MTGTSLIDTLEWSPVAVLPGVSLRSSAEIGNEFARIVSADHAIIRTLAQTYPNLGKFSEQFTDAFGNSVRPSWIVVQKAFQRRHSDGEALIAFRNTVALSAILPVAASNLVKESSSGISRFSDPYDLYPWMLDTQLNELVMANASVIASHLVSEFCGQCPPQTPQSVLTELDVDTRLLEALMRKWTECFVSRHSSADDRRLFRSLQMAFEAARLPSKYYTSDLDLGRQVSLWVSAHEILINDDESQSLASKVRRKLACFQAITPALNKKSYRHKLGGKYVAHTLAQKAYSCLNDARNDYLHGNRVTPSALRPRGYNASVFQVAPPLFRLLLEVRLFGGAQIQTSQVFALEDLNVMAAEIDRRSEFNSVRETLEQPILAFRHQPLTNKHW